MFKNKHAISVSDLCGESEFLQQKADLHCETFIYYFILSFCISF